MSIFNWRSWWNKASNHTTQPKKRASLTVSLLTGSAISLVALMQGCASTSPTAVSVTKPPPMPTPSNWTCVSPDQIQELTPELNMSDLSDFPASNIIIKEAQLHGVKICKSPDSNTILNPTLNANDPSTFSHGVTLAAAYPNYNAVLLADIPLSASYYLHEVLHTIQENTKTQYLDPLTGTMSGISIQDMQTLLAAESGCFAMQGISEYRRYLRTHDQGLHDYYMNAELANDPLAQTYQYIHQRVTNDPALLNKLGNADTPPSPELLDDTMANFLAKGTYAYAPGYLQNGTKRMKTFRETPLDLDPVSYTQEEVKALAYGAVIRNGPFAKTQKELKSLGNDLSKALDAMINKDELSPEKFRKNMTPFLSRIGLQLF